MSETRTEKNVSTEAMRSSPECAASERMPRLPVVTPTATLSPVITRAAKTELPATARFSARIKSDGDIAGVPDMLELSLLRVETAKPSAQANASRVVLRFPAWHFHLSGGPIPEDNCYAYELAGVCVAWDARLGTSRAKRASAASPGRSGGCTGGCRYLG